MRFRKMKRRKHSVRMQRPYGWGGKYLPRVNTYSQRSVVKASWTAAGSLGRHIKYLQRDGTSVLQYERDEEGRVVRKYRTAQEMFTSGGAVVRGDNSLLEEMKGEKKFLRLVISPENGNQIDMKNHTVEVMNRLERAIGKKLNWVAVTHHNTDQAHAHVVIRGIDRDGKQLWIPRDVISYGIREISMELATLELGERTESEVKQQRERDVISERFTEIDKQIKPRISVRGGEFHIGLTRSEVEGSEFADRMHRRLQHLVKLGIARYQGPLHFVLRRDWETQLNEMAYKRDIIKTMYNDLREREIIPDDLSQRLLLWNGYDRIDGTLIHKDFMEEGTGYQVVYVKDDKGDIYYHSGLDIDKEYLTIGQRVTLEPAMATKMETGDELDVDTYKSKITSYRKPGERILRTWYDEKGFREPKYRDSKLNALMRTSKSDRAYLRAIQEFAGSIPATSADVDTFVRTNLSKLSLDDQSMVAIHLKLVYENLRAVQHVLHEVEAQRKNELRPLFSLSEVSAKSYLKILEGVTRVPLEIGASSKQVDSYVQEHFADISEYRQKKLGDKIRNAISEASLSLESFETIQHDFERRIREVLTGGGKDLVPLVEQYTGSRVPTDHRLGPFLKNHFESWEPKDLSRLLDGLFSQLPPDIQGGVEITVDPIAREKAFAYSQQVFDMAQDLNVGKDDLRAELYNQFSSIPRSERPFEIIRYIDRYLPGLDADQQMVVANALTSERIVDADVARAHESASADEALQPVAGEGRGAEALYLYQQDEFDFTRFLDVVHLENGYTPQETHRGAVETFVKLQYKDMQEQNQDQMIEAIILAQELEVAKELGDQAKRLESQSGDAKGSRDAGPSSASRGSKSTPEHDGSARDADVKR
jgi:type IV secretory pathway VirD2 relaxase